ncbi:M23 family metallopeptidase [Candidatus Uhrbacteria bacterium]|nr:M23 family metallopeptidase [Candidatus Uhrbacteria bacterium]
MKRRMLHKAFRLILAIFEGFLRVSAQFGRLLRVFGYSLGKGVKYLIRPFSPGVLFVYLIGRKVKAGVMRRIIELRGNLWCGLSHRYVAHGLLIALVMIVSAPSLAASGLSGGIFGNQMPLQEVVGSEGFLGAGGDGEFLIKEDDVVPVEEVDSYLEALFQDQPRPEGEDPGIPLVFEGGALLSQDLPGVSVPLTRTEIVEYEVSPGDSPWMIAEKFGISVATVLWENNLSLWSTIKPGQKLKILPVSGISHTVRKGETLASITKKYKSAVADIQEYNSTRLIDGSLAVGTVLVIPGGRPIAVAPPAPVYRREIVSVPNFAPGVGAKLTWPVPTSRRITQYYSWRHAGLDIGDRTGNPIVAAETGVVEYAGWGRGGWGNTVVIDNGGGMKTRYAHASKILVEPGQAVSRGETIALVGSTGRSTGPHLHLTVYINGRVINPLQYLK